MCSSAARPALARRSSRVPWGTPPAVRDVPRVTIASHGCSRTWESPRRTGPTPACSRGSKTDLLLVDEWGLAPLSVLDARELLEVIDDRCTTRSTLIASQLPVDAWHGTIPDPSLADALLDRIVHTARKIALRGESMRKLRAKKVS